MPDIVQIIEWNVKARQLLAEIVTFGGDNCNWVASSYDPHNEGYRHCTYCYQPVHVYGDVDRRVQCDHDESCPIGRCEKLLDQIKKG